MRETNFVEEERPMPFYIKIPVGLRVVVGYEAKVARSGYVKLLFGAVVTWSDAHELVK